jgi:hypothetical protein
MRHTAFGIACAMLVSGCTMTRSSRRTLITAGAVTAAAGVIMVAAGPREFDSNSNGVNESALNDDYMMPAIGALALFAGLGMLVGGAASTPLPQPTEVQMVAVPPARPRLDGKAPLPEVPVDAHTLHQAQQARLLIAAGHCEAARPLLHDIATRSYDYHLALVQGPVLDPCPGLRYR